MNALFQSFLISLFFFFSNNLRSQESPSVKEFSSADQKKAIDTIVSAYEKNYIFPDKVEKMKNELLSNFKSGKYKNVTNPYKFAERLTQDMQKVNPDRHMRIFYKSQKKLYVDLKTETNSVEEKHKTENYGFKEVKIIDGNIGYLNLDSFTSAKIASKTARTALDFVWNSDAIIIDLRNNLGGEDSMVQFIASRFLEDKPMILSSSYLKKFDAYRSINLIEGPNVPRRPEVDLYVLVNSQTYSAAEQFAYILKNLKRATIVGEQTGGAANSVEEIDLGDFTALVSTGYPIDPITNTNWEEIGVTPDIQVIQGDALKIAQIKALEKLYELNPNHKEYEWILNYLNVKENQNDYSKKLSKFTGKFETMEIILENQNLYLKPTSFNKIKLLPSTPDTFYTESFQQKIVFTRSNNKITGFNIIWSTGRELKYTKAD